MSFNEGDRVHIHGRSDYRGTVTTDRDSMFPSMRGVRWDDGEFAFVNPIKLAHVDPVAIPGMTEHERQALGEAYRSALDAVDPIGFVTATNAPTDWQMRAERAEATVERVRDMHKPITRKGWRPDATETVCSECIEAWSGDHDNAPWPCSTIEALDADR